MRLSTILELLLIFLLIAFAAYGRVIERDIRAIGKKSSSSNQSVNIASLKQTAENVNKYCVCNENICNCCRDFHIPLVRLAGPGCASLQYLQEDKLAMQLSIGDNILSTNVVNGRNPKPVCVALPGGFTKFCGKIYSIKREADKHFKACLGLELRSAAELEASLRVSCFRFGPDGLKLRPAEPLPTSLSEPSTTSDDDYDIFGLDDDEDDDEEDDDYEKVSPENNAVSGPTLNEQQDQDQDQDQDQEEDDEDDLLGFGALFDIFTGDDETTTNKKTKLTTSTPLPSSFSIPILSLTTTLDANGNRIPLVNKTSITPSSLLNPETISLKPVISIIQPSMNLNNKKNSSLSSTTSESGIDTSIIIDDNTATSTKDKINDEETTSIADIGVTEAITDVTESHKIVTKHTTHATKIDKINHKKNVNKKTSSSWQSANAISGQVTKPQQSHLPSTTNVNLDDDYDDSEEDEDSDEVDYNNDEKIDNEQSDKDENEDNNKNVQDEEEQNDDYEESEDDDESQENDDEEDEVLSALVDYEKNPKKSSKKHKKESEQIKNNNKTQAQIDDTDYNYDLAEFLARKQQPIRTVNVRKI